MFSPASAPSSWRLSPDVHAVAVDEDLVFLSVDGDRYFCLAGAATAVAVGKDRTVAIRDPALAAELAQAGLVRPASALDVIPASTPWRPPTATALRWTYPWPEARDFLSAAAATFDVVRHYQGRSLKQILAAAAAPPPGKDRARPDELLALVDRFHRWIPFAPVSGKCLLRSFMLRRLLHRHGFTADWVFGVATWPFEAHCWLQTDDLVLDDTAERVAGYTPIMVA